MLKYFSTVEIMKLYSANRKSPARKTQRQPHPFHPETESLSLAASVKCDVFSKIALFIPVWRVKLGKNEGSNN